MQPSDYLAILNILVAFFGVLLVAALGLEWVQLRALRRELTKLENRLQSEIHASMKAAHRVISSYGIEEADCKIGLLKSALSAYPLAFNAWNALGYAYLQKGETEKALDAFYRAIASHPDDKAGYCDLACTYAQLGNLDLALQYCKQAIEVDESALQDILADGRLKDLWGKLTP